MTGEESRALQEAWAVDLLDAEEELEISEHIETCGECNIHWEDLSGAFAALTAAVDEADARPISGDLREQVLAGALAAIEEDPSEAEAKKDVKQDEKKGLTAPAQVPTQDAQALGIQVKLKCSYCHSPTSREEVTFCAACLAPHHRECFRAHGRCSTLGCEEVRTVRPVTPDLGPREAGSPEAPDFLEHRKRRRRRLGSGLFLGALVLGGGIAALYWTSLPLVTVTKGGSSEPKASPDSFDAMDLEIAQLRRDARFRAPAKRLLERMREAASRGDRSTSERLQREMRDLCNEAVEHFPSLQGEAFQVLGEADNLRREADDRSRMDLLVDDEEIASVVSRISGVAGRAILVDPDVQETVTLSMRQVTWEDALEEVARRTRCRVEVRTDGGLLLSQPPKVTIQFTDANVRTVIQLLAAYSGRNVVVSPEVRGNVTLDLKEAAWDEALVSIIQTVGDYQVSLVGRDIVQVETRLAAELRGTPPMTIKLWHPGSRRSQQETAVEDTGTRTHVSLSFTDSPLVEVVESLGKQANRTFTVDSLVDETIDVDLTNVTWQHALRVVASAARCQVESRSQGRVMVLTQQPKVTIQFTDANVRTVLQLLAAYSGKNILMSPDVRGTLILDLSETRWDAALQAVVETTGDFQAWTIGQDMATVRTKSAGAVEGGRLLELQRYWSLLPDDATRVELTLSGEATLADYCAEITRQTGCPIVIEGQPSTRTFPIYTEDSWRDAVREVSAEAGYSVQETEQGLVLRPTERNTLRAFHANIRTWVQLMATLAHEDIVMSPAVRGTATLELQDASYSDALTAAVRAQGLRIDRVADILRVLHRTGSGRHAGHTQALTEKQFDLNGNSYPMLTLTGIALTPSKRYAILGDRVYSAGDTLIDEQTDEEIVGLTVAEVGQDRIRLLQGDAAVWLIAERTPDGRYQTIVNPHEGPLPPEDKALNCGLGLVDGSADSLAKNEALGGLLELIGEPAIAPLLRLVQDPAFRGRGSAALVLARLTVAAKADAALQRRVRAALSVIAGAVDRVQQGYGERALGILDGEK